MKALVHAAVSLAIGVPLYLAFSSVEAFVLCFLTGLFLDVDHLIDYLWWSEDKNLRRFFSLGPGYFDRPHSTDKFLHSIELFSLLVIPIMLTQPIFGVGVIVGFIGHISLDFWGFGFSPFHFFLSYRAIVEKKRVISLREAILERDDFRCRNCGATGDLQIHKGIKLGRLGRWNNVDEWTTVCEPCHIQRHETGMFY